GAGAGVTQGVGTQIPALPATDLIAKMFLGEGEDRLVQRRQRVGLRDRDLKSDLGLLEARNTHRKGLTRNRSCGQIEGRLRLDDLIEVARRSGRERTRDQEGGSEQTEGDVADVHGYFLCSGGCFWSWVSSFAVKLGWSACKAICVPEGNCEA